MVNVGLERSVHGPQLERKRLNWAIWAACYALMDIDRWKAALSAHPEAKARPYRCARGSSMSHTILFRTTRPGFFLGVIVVLGLNGLAPDALADCSDQAQFDAATQPGPDSEVGNCVLNPSTGERANVTDVLTDNNGLNTYVLTDAGDLILMRYELGDVIACIEPEVDTGDCETYVVVTSNTNAGTMLVESVELQFAPPAEPNTPDPPLNETLVQDGSDELDSEAADNASTPGPSEVIPVQGNAGLINEPAVGSGGSNGAVAYGVRICFPFIGCVNIGRPGSDGTDGAPGPALDRTVAASHGAIRSDQAQGVPGIRLTSVGGNGGTGSSTRVSNFGPYDGGNGGDGGSITLNNVVDVTTTRNNSHGILVVSQSGSGGLGGSSFLGTGGGTGGEASQGGTILIENAGDIRTQGDSSHGIYALSVGGTGGSGGDGWGIVGRAGSGSIGGNGGVVTVNNSALIDTQGNNSHGILAQSIGGTGGSAGSVGGLVALGGSADGGGDASAVTINNRPGGVVQTSGDYSVGLLGQSIGGGGGDGGGSASLFTSLGGSSAVGGIGGQVVINNEATSDLSDTDAAQIMTSGSDAHAILAQSIGGGGGNAGNAGGLLVVVGGAGGAGGAGGTVEVTNGGMITTTGERARGIFAQSIGGGGGTGGTASGALAIGGRAGSASNAAAVTVNNIGDITTVGTRSIAVQAQSIGGGGGDGGSASGIVTVGGSAGSGGGGMAGTVTVNQTGRVSTSGDDAIGMLVQAIGGGGGNGGSATSGGVITGAAVGGQGGNGGDGGEVIVTLGAADQIEQAQVATEGDGAIGILAQSIGGSGGNGGGAVQLSTGALVAVSTAVGGAGSGAGNGATATLNGSGAITTSGDNATGVLLQSVGGGGGNGGTSVAGAGQFGIAGVAAATTVGASAGGGGNGGLVNSDFDGSVTTTGAAASGFVAQSIGGGGGNGGTSIGAALNVTAGGGGSVSTAIGGSGGVGGIGRNVTVTLGSDASQTIATRGDQSTGVLVQSIGGGGGNGGLTVAGAVSGSAGIDVAVSTAVGGAGASAGMGGVVDLTVGSNVVTEGDLATGIVAQSIGGGGGTGGTAIGASATLSGVGSLAVSTSVGGSAGGGGNGSDVDAVIGGANANLVQTSGDRAAGVLVQSVGGGGGTGGTSIAATLSVGVGAVGGGISTAIGGAGGNGGDGGNVDAQVTSNILTQGDGSGGVIAQSVGGGGGNGGLSVAAAVSGGGVGAASISTALGGSGGTAGNGGTAILGFDGSVETQQDNATGLLVQSVGGGGGNGGGTIAATLAIGPGVAGVAVSTALGGAGGAAGDGGTIDIDDTDPTLLPALDAYSVLLENATGSVLTLGNNSAGIVAQSIGGGGGNGGYSIAASGSAGGTIGGSVSVGIGGAGGAGGAGTSVFANSAANISTSGRDSTGFLAQSVGGGGGNGGFNVSVAVAGAGGFGGGIAVGVGGSAGAGSDGGKVNAVSSGTIVTRGERSTGMLAQSVGGGGGNGGASIAVSGGVAAGGGAALSVGVGGNGGAAANGALVVAETSGDIVTLGDNSAAVLAQSVGGGGGNGGFSVASGVSLAGTGGGAAIGIGGSGGAGGDGGIVQLTVDNDIATLGTNADGVIAQSIGGGGGNGGIAIAVGGSGASGVSLAAGIGIGGRGAEAGHASAVSSNVTGVVTTEGNSSTGVLTQAVGGGGGNGAIGVGGAVSVGGSTSAAVAVGVGGAGGQAGDGADVVADMRGFVQTQGDDATGVLTQSVGGGGGNGAMAIGAALNGGTNGGSIAVAVGGAGGSGGNAASVQSTLNGDVVTTGDRSSAVVAQSVGGGGGNGGISIAGAVNLTASSGGALSVGVGGFGGDGGAAGDVALDVIADLTTTGNNSHGLLAQSLGGGGGNGGLNVSGAVNLTGTGTGTAVAIGVGGFGGNGGDSGAVDVDYQGTLLALPTDTDGAGSHGLIAQSIAGGGGTGGMNFSGALSYVSSSETGDGNALLFGIGGFGGVGADAGAVNVDVLDSSRIAAFGDDHSAILAQSIGGGGGNGGTNIGLGIASDAPLVFGMGGFGSAGGLGRAVEVNASADLSTAGRNGHGIFAQSVGGGGGNGGLNVSGAISFNEATAVPTMTFGMGGFGGDGSGSGTVDVNHAGTIITQGASAHGIFAQSLAGGGGNGGMNVSTALNLPGSSTTSSYQNLSIVVGMGGHGGEGALAARASVVSTGDISTTGDHARGIFAQSIGGGGGNGGINFSGNLATNRSLITAGIGGFGAGGGAAGVASVSRGSEQSAAGTIATDGISAHGIEATSIGGGGGDAGINIVAQVVSASQTPDSTSPDEPNQQPRHQGMDDEVFTNYDAVIAEFQGQGNSEDDSPDSGDDADSAQSPYAVQIAIGGSSGSAGDAGEAEVIHFGNILTRRQSSHGIFAQSIGGGGGNAAFNTTMTVAEEGASTRGMGLLVGGAAGDGGMGKQVTVGHSGTIQTLAAGSYGIFAQSVGGGGGNAAGQFEFDDLDGGEDIDRDSGELVMSIGRRGGTGGDAGEVVVAANGVVITEGENAHGVFAQSVGGGGGNGGYAGGAADTAVLALGGAGGTGGFGNLVRVTAGADIFTLGQGAIGVLAQSVGGGGGTGGMSDATIGGNDAAIAVSLGASGGSGATGGAVTVTNTGVIGTLGDQAHGIFAQSLGGGGGNAGMAVTSLGIAEQSEDDALQVALGVGADGGLGAESGIVNIYNFGRIQTEGRQAAGIFAQSIGGGGGNASQLVTSTSAAGVKASLALGASGGEAAFAGAVNVENRVREDGTAAQIVTLGDEAHGIVAMSIGGGGGTGSVVESRRIPPDEESLPLISSGASTAISLGGDGGSGGAGGQVDVTNDGQITTFGRGSHGIMAQSIGGGGGNGGTVFVQPTRLQDAASSLNHNLSVGGSGGTGNVGRNVTVVNTGDIDVSGDGAYGVFAQSIGGGGGNGGAAGVPLTAQTPVDGERLDSPTVPSLVDMSLGGNGGSGGNSGDVTVTHTGSIVSRGADSFGIFAQSIAGGGGTLGASFGSAVGTAADVLMPVFLGSTEAGSGQAGLVTVNSTGTIVMLGDNGRAHNVQSVNGGGGELALALDLNAATAAGQAPVTVSGPIVLGSNSANDSAGSIVEASHSGDLMTLGNDAVASATQSIGGGGGNGQVALTINGAMSVDLALALGGSDSANNDGGNINFVRNGNVMTAGANASATTVQSIGGGGGSLAVDIVRADEQMPVPAVDGTVAGTAKPVGYIADNRIKLTDTVSLPETRVLADSAAATTSAATLQLGADGGANNNGGNIVLGFAGDQITEGNASPAILVQSIGGGGGYTRLNGLDSATIDYGGVNGASGDGGLIELRNTGDVFASGEGSHGMLLQSIGGGGGLVLTDLSSTAVDWSLSADNSGSGGDIELMQVGDIVVSGDNAFALIAQSLGGGGGIVDTRFFGSAGGIGSAGDINLDLNGSLVAIGDQGVGLFAQSVGNTGAGDISISLARDHFIYGGEAGVAVSLSGGAQNQLTSSGTIVTADGVDGLALRSDGGVLRVDNFGTVVGNVALSAGENAFFNAEDALFLAGSSVDLGGSASVLSNAGLLAPGGTGNAQVTNLNGSLIQTATGSMIADIDFASGTADQVLASGSVTLGGSVQTQLLNTAVIPVGSFSQTLFRAEQGLTNNGFTLDAMPSVVVQYAIRYTDSEAILDYDIDFAAAGLGENLAAVGNYLNRGQIAGGGNAPYGEVISKLVFDPDLATYRNSLSQLSPDFYAEHQVQLMNSTLDFAQRLMSCERPGGEYRQTVDGNCVWVQIDQYSTSNDAEGDYKATDGTTGRYSLGMQAQISDAWSLGFSLSRESNQSDGYEQSWRSHSDTNQWGLMLARRHNDTLLSGAFTYGSSRAVTNRRGALVNTIGTLAERKMETWSGLLQASHRIPVRDWYLKPSLSAGLVELRARSSAESGAAALNLIFLDHNETHAWLRPAIEIGKTFELGTASQLNLNLELSAQEYLTGSTTVIDARLAGAPSDIAPLSVGADLGDPLYRARFGIDFLGMSDIRTQLFFDTGYHGRHDLDAVNLRFEFPLR